MPDLLQSSDFLPHLNSNFSVRLPGSEPIDLELVAVEGLGEAASPEYRRPFSLIFLGPVSNQYLPQHTWRLEHAEMGALDIFIVPLGPQNGRMQYQAIFG